ncbi:hypothetical protein [Sphingomonas sp. ERG5]|uniref:hypothetical protein n=1 Tax=Sphingomonas sp. ERG5 TaxID=1381597 RepID=UPI00054BFD41|nr:hypothetical protein [Sphingomonas sp. ERG5]
MVTDQWAFFTVLDLATVVALTCLACLGAARAVVADATVGMAIIAMTAADNRMRGLIGVLLKGPAIPAGHSQDISRTPHGFR